MGQDETTEASRSRRERPAKPALTRETIVSAALNILKTEGLSKVTMRRIAAALDTGPASLYVYVRNTEDLHAQVLDRLLGSVGEAPAGALGSGKGSWQARLSDLLTRYAFLLYEFPELARMATSTQPSGPNYLTLVDGVLELLTEGGVPGREAAWAVDLLLLYATANAAEHGTKKASPGSAAAFSALEGEVRAADAAQYPQVARLGDELLSGGGPERFAWGLEVLLSGVLSTRRTSSERK